MSCFLKDGEPDDCMADFLSSSFPIVVHNNVFALLAHNLAGNKPTDIPVSSKNLVLCINLHLYGQYQERRLAYTLLYIQHLHHWECYIEPTHLHLQ